MSLQMCDLCVCVCVGVGVCARARIVSLHGDIRGAAPLWILESVGVCLPISVSAFLSVYLFLTSAPAHPPDKHCGQFCVGASSGLLLKWLFSGWNHSRVAIVPWACGCSETPSPPHKGVVQEEERAELPVQGSEGGYISKIPPLQL